MANAKRERVLGVETLEEGGIRFYDPTEKVADTFTFQTTSCPDAIRGMLEDWGARVLFQQRSSQDVGYKAKLATIKETAALLISGEWKAEREGGFGGGISVEVELVMELTKMDAKSARASWKAQTEKDATFAERFTKKHAKRLEELRAKRTETEVTGLDDLA